MCTDTVQVYAMCACRQISHFVCYAHIDYTRQQIDDKPCPKFAVKLLDRVEGARVGTRNHPGPCPQTHESYAFQTQAEADAEARSKMWSPKEIEKSGTDGMWNATNKLASAKLASSGLSKVKEEEMEGAGEQKVKIEEQEMEIDKPFEQLYDQQPALKKRKKRAALSGPITDVEIPPADYEMEDETVIKEEESERPQPRYRY